MIRIDAAAKHYGTGPAAIRAVDGISLEVPRGDFFILLGHSGSGKTTLLNLMAGMTRPDTGRIEIAGRNLMDMQDAELAHFRAATIGFVFQFQSLLATLNALENVRLPALFRRQRSEREEAQALLARVGLAGREKAYPHELSLGQQRRVGVARALIGKPDLLLCDEPTGDLDPETEQVIMGLIAEAHQAGTTVVMVTHNHDLCAYASRVVCIEHGRIAVGARGGRRDACDE